MRHDVNGAKLDAELDRRAERIDAELAERLPETDTSSLYAAARHLLDAGGSRVQPTVLLLVAEACDPDRATPLPMALSIELLDAYALVHGDLIHDTDRRRGVQTVHNVWDRSTAILAGDYLHARAFDFVHAVDASIQARERCLRTLTTACRQLCEGRMMALDGDGAPLDGDDATLDRYVAVLERTSGALTAGAARSGAVLGDASEEIVDASETAGRSLGVALALSGELVDHPTPEPSAPVTVDDTERRETAATYAGRAKEQFASLPSGPSTETLVRLAEDVADRNP